MPYLVVEKGKDRGLAVEVREGQTLSIGRRSESDLHITDTLSSRKHCIIESRDGGYHIRDNDSRNGTFLNGRRISEENLASGDQILIGETLITFQLESPAKDLLIGCDVGGYKILDLLGKGGMGRVYKSLQLSLERIVALKILSKQFASDANFIGRFRREAMALAKLNHPNIVAVYDVGQDKDYHFFSMECMDGGSIAQKISGGRKLSPDEAVPVILQVAKGLQYAEDMGVVHRDIKPENMMIDVAGNVKICDLGIAQSINDTDLSARGVFGSPHYIAPEQAKGDPPDNRSDIYSLGASFYRIVTGRTMFKGGSARELILKHLQETPLPVEEVEPAVTPELARIITKMIARDVDERYQSAGEVVTDLERLQHKSKHTAKVGSKPARKGGRKLFLIILFLLLLLAGAGYELYNRFGHLLHGQPVAVGEESTESGDQQP